MTESERTPEEQRVFEQVAQTHGEEWAEQHEELILAQATLVGEIPPRDQQR